MKRHMVAALAVAAVAFVAAPATTSAANPLRGAKEAITGKTQTDAAFIKEAAQGGMAEVELGRLGVERAESPDVKQFAQRMVEDHSKANDELKPIASKEGVTIPKTLDPKHKATKDKLAKLSGHDFDRAYMREMTSDHNHDVSAFQKQLAKTRDPELKSWIEKTLTTVKEHQQLAQETASKVGATMTGRVTGTVQRMTHRGRSNQGDASR
ncbi:MAG: DUF4142 domain-containing protein [Deltaproteobacteria bacterium]|nr:MAG: DUF4142 domain-containing protein [Deltaproteobacteria bacterium]